MVCADVGDTALSKGLWRYGFTLEAVRVPRSFGRRRSFVVVRKSTVLPRLRSRSLKAVKYYFTVFTFVIRYTVDTFYLIRAAHHLRRRLRRQRPPRPTQYAIALTCHNLNFPPSRLATAEPGARSGSPLSASEPGSPAKGGARTTSVCIVS